MERVFENKVTVVTGGATASFQHEAGLKFYDWMKQVIATHGESIGNA